MAGVPVSVLVSTLIAQGIKDLPQEVPGAADALPGARIYFVVAPTGGQDGAELGAVFNPPLGTRLELDFGVGILVFTNDGVALVLSGQSIDSIKQFGPEHARLVFAWNNDTEARDRVLAESFQVITNEEALAVREPQQESGTQ